MKQVSMDEIKIAKINARITNSECEEIAEFLGIDYEDVKSHEDGTITITCSSEECEALRDEGRFFEEISYALDCSRSEIEEVEID